MFLDMHPDLATTSTYEVHFFDKEKNFKLGLEWYR